MKSFKNIRPKLKLFFYLMSKNSPTKRSFPFCIVRELLVVAVSSRSNHVVILDKMRDEPLFCLLKQAPRNKHQEHIIMFAHLHTVQAYTKLIVRFVLVDVM